MVASRPLTRAELDRLRPLVRADRMPGDAAAVLALVAADLQRPGLRSELWAIKRMVRD